MISGNNPGLTGTGPGSGGNDPGAPGNDAEGTGTNPGVTGRNPVRPGTDPWGTGIDPGATGNDPAGTGSRYNSEAIRRRSKRCLLRPGRVLTSLALVRRLSQAAGQVARPVKNTLDPQRLAFSSWASRLTPGAHPQLVEMFRRQGPVRATHGGQEKLGQFP